MIRKRDLISAVFTWLLLIGGIALLLATPQARAAGGSADGDVIIVGGQDSDVEADGGRDAKFERNRDIPGGLVLDYLQWSHSSDNNWFQVRAWDATQLDEGMQFRAGWGEKVRIRAGYQSTPHRYGDRATFILGRGANDDFAPSYRIADFIQQTLENPDGEGDPFYTSTPGFAIGPETAQDNSLVSGFMRDILSGQERFSLQTRRRAGSFGITLMPSRNWSLDFDIHNETRHGRQALGSGTYQRVTDVNDNGDGTYGDGITDYDYFFAVRGMELPAFVDYRTTRLEAAANYQNKSWFARIGASVSEFENDYTGITYDNPFWFNGVDATSGSRRGLWEEGRVSLEPSNEAMELSVSGGVNLPARTRITASLSLGEHTQDVPFLPITTNPATIATADINRDTVVNALDDPTLVPAALSGLPSMIDGAPVIGRHLNGNSDITALNLAITSRPLKKLSLTARYRSYDYEGGEGIQAIPARTEYIESHVKLDFKGDTILHVPNDFARETIKLEAAWRFSNSLKVKAFAKRKSYDYKLYQDPDANSSRDSGTRAVAGTDDDTLGATLLFGRGGWMSGRLTLQTSDRDYSGAYTTAFSGENPDVRQYDISNRERDAADIQLDFMPSDKLTLGFGYRFFNDDYPGAVYGLQQGDTNGLDLNLNYAFPNGVSLFAYADVSEWDADMHMRTKCSNCSGYGSWEVPNFDWFSGYTDTTTGIGGGLSFDAGSKTKLQIQANYLNGEVEQTTSNTATPVNLQDSLDNPRAGETATVALGFDFPTQENRLLSTEIKLSRRISDRLVAGLWWRYEDFDLDDFQWDGLQPYGPDGLDVRVPGIDQIGDDATRYLFLDSRYRDYTAHVVQVFLKISL